MKKIIPFFQFGEVAFRKGDIIRVTYNKEKATGRVYDVEPQRIILDTSEQYNAHNLGILTNDITKIEVIKIKEE
jgi:hypothetical protein